MGADHGSDFHFVLARGKLSWQPLWGQIGVIGLTHFHSASHVVLADRNADLRTLNGDYSYTFSRNW